MIQISLLHEYFTQHNILLSQCISRKSIYMIKYRQIFFRSRRITFYNSTATYNAVPYRKTNLQSHHWLTIQPFDFCWSLHYLVYFALLITVKMNYFCFKALQSVLNSAWGLWVVFFLCVCCFFFETMPNLCCLLFMHLQSLLNFLWIGCRLTVHAECPMHLEDFPMDFHSCPLKFGSCE